MKKTAKYFVFAALLTAAFLAGTWYRQDPVAATSKSASAGGRRILRYSCPMHPQFVSDRPGDAPCCGMRLEPVYAGGHGGPGSVEISGEQQQRFGVRVATVGKSSGAHTLRLPGRVVPHESRVTKMIAGFEGVFREVLDVTTGARVKRGQPLATVFGYESRPQMQLFLTALDNYDRESRVQPPSPDRLKIVRDGLDSAIGRLQALGVPPTQIEELRRTRKLPANMMIGAPVDGFVLARNASTGQRFAVGEEWYRFADLSKVWVLADAFGADAEHLRPGMKTRISLPGQSREFTAVVSETLPQVDAATRTLKIRLEVDNPDVALRPDMFVDVEMPVAVSTTIAIPAEAVLNSGLAKRVFLDRGNGYFEPRQVETGAYFGDKVEIKRGLREGERIVVSGTFLVDSESRMRFPDAGHVRHEATNSQGAKDPVCGMSVDPAKARGGTSQRGGKTYYFCAKDCKDKFDKEPAMYSGDRS